MFRQETVSNDETILVIGGPLSGDAVAEFQRKMEALSASRFLTITLDLSQAPTINSEALGKLLVFRKKLVELGKTLQIRGCSDGMYKVFLMIQFDKLMSITK
jgi:anti-anti-sigma regulatory factor